MANQRKRIDYDAMHRRNVIRYQRDIEKLYEEAARQCALLGASVGRLEDDVVFAFDHFPELRRRAERLIRKLYASVYTVVLNGIEAEWTLANNKNSELARMVFGKNVGKLSKEQYARYFSNNWAARDAFIKRKDNGMNLSERVWNFIGQFKEEVETALDVGIHSGESADALARDLKMYLKYPDKLFRRVRDEQGNLHLSKRASQFHPGQGVYRSSYKNARRLAVTETNMAYHSADYERWQQLDFVVGIEVRLSGNHTCLGRDGKRHEFIDICDDLQGRYPKDFKFTGWHPHCRCQAISILKTEEELMEENRAIMRGDDPPKESVNTVKDVPDGFKNWVKDNRDRIERAEKKGTLPYFLRDNEAFWRNNRT